MSAARSGPEGICLTASGREAPPCGNSSCFSGLERRQVMQLFDIHSLGRAVPTDQDIRARAKQHTAESDRCMQARTLCSLSASFWRVMSVNILTLDVQQVTDAKCTFGQPVLCDDKSINICTSQKSGSRSWHDQWSLTIGCLKRREKAACQGHVTTGKQPEALSHVLS